MKRGEKTASYTVDRRWERELGRGKRKRKKADKDTINWMKDEKLLFIVQKSVHLGRAVLHTYVMENKLFSLYLLLILWARDGRVRKIKREGRRRG